MVEVVVKWYKVFLVPAPPLKVPVMQALEAVGISLSCSKREHGSKNNWLSLFLRYHKLMIF